MNQENIYKSPNSSLLKDSFPKKENKLGPISLFILRLNMATLVLLVIGALLTTSIKFVMYVIPYCLNIAILMGSQRRIFIKTGIIVNYIYAVLWVIASTVIMFGSEFMWPTVVTGIFFLCLGSVLCWFSAKQIKRNYPNL